MITSNTFSTIKLLQKWLISLNALFGRKCRFLRYSIRTVLSLTKLEKFDSKANTIMAPLSCTYKIVTRSVEQQMTIAIFLAKISAIVVAFTSKYQRFMPVAVSESQTLWTKRVNKKYQKIPFANYQLRLKLLCLLRCLNHRLFGRNESTKNIKKYLSPTTNYA